MIAENEDCTDLDKDNFSLFEGLPPNPGQFKCKKCNATKNENEDTCYNCNSKEFVQVKCPQCSSIDIAEVVGGIAPEPGISGWEDFVRGRIKFGWGCVVPPPGEMQSFFCNDCEFSW